MKTLSTILLSVVLLLLVGSDVVAQQPLPTRGRRVRGATSAVWIKDEYGDSMLFVKVSAVRVYHNRRQTREWLRMVKAVKKVYPLALEAARRMDDIDVDLSELERRRDRKEYTSAVEETLKEEITPMLWKMTRYEGVILLKLIDRETNHTAFAIIKDFRSGFTAGFYQMLAKLFGNNLKLHYDPEGEDKMLEQVVLYYKAGLL